MMLTQGNEVRFEITPFHRVTAREGLELHASTAATQLLHELSELRVIHVLQSDSILIRFLVQRPIQVASGGEQR